MEMTAKKEESILTFIALGLIFLCLGLQLYAAWRPPQATLGHMVNDDAFYYLKIARNFARGKGLSFDGLHRTNGFHPLWQILLLPLACIPADPALFLSLALSLCAILNMAGGLLVFRLLGVVANRRYALLGVAIYCHFMIFTIAKGFALNGLESSLYFAALCLAIYLTLERCRRLMDDSSDYGSQYWMGLAWGLLGLTRLETIPLTGIMMAALWYAGRKTKRPLFTWRDLALFAAVLAPYFLCNIIFFKHILPVSAAVKINNSKDFIAAQGGFSLANTNLWKQIASALLRSLRKQLNWVFPWGRGFLPDRLISNSLLILFFCSMGALAAGLYYYRRQPRPFLPALRLLGLFSLFAGFHLIWTHFSLSPYTVYCTWYYVSQYLLLILWLPLSLFILQQVLTERWLILKKWLERISLAIISAGVILYLIGYPAIAGHISRLSSRSGLYIVRYQTALWIRDNLPKNAIYSAWNAGILSYFSERDLINLDGLVNNYELVDYKRNNRFLYDYLKAKRVDYVVDYAPRNYLRSDPQFSGVPLSKLELIREIEMDDYRNLYIFSLKK